MSISLKYLNFIQLEVLEIKANLMSAWKLDKPQKTH